MKLANSASNRVRRARPSRSVEKRGNERLRARDHPGKLRLGKTRLEQLGDGDLNIHTSSITFVFSTVNTNRMALPITIVICTH